MALAPGVGTWGVSGPGKPSRGGTASRPPVTTLLAICMGSGGSGRLECIIVRHLGERARLCVSCGPGAALTTGHPGTDLPGHRHVIPRHPPRQQLPHHHPKRKHIAGGDGPPARQHLGRLQGGSGGMPRPCCLPD